MAFEQFLIQTGLIGIGLLLALYVVIIPNFKKQILDKQLEKFRKKYDEVEMLVNKIKNNIQTTKKDYELLSQKRQELDDYSKPPRWITWGILTDIVLLSISALFPLLDIIGFPLPLNSTTLISLSELALTCGVILFIIVAFKVFIELNFILIGEFEDMIDKSKKVSDEVKNIVKKQQKITSTSYIKKN